MTDQPALRDLVAAMLCTVDDYGPDADTLTIHFEALRAALAAQPEPTALDMVTDLHRAVYGDTWARPETPQQVWEMLLDRVRGLAAAGPATPHKAGVGRMERDPR